MGRLARGTKSIGIDGTWSTTACDSCASRLAFGRRHSYEKYPMTRKRKMHVLSRFVDTSLLQKASGMNTMTHLQIISLRRSSIAACNGRTYFVCLVPEMTKPPSLFTHPSAIVV